MMTHWDRGPLSGGTRGNIRSWHIGGIIGLRRGTIELSLDFGPVGGWVRLNLNKGKGSRKPRKDSDPVERGAISIKRRLYIAILFIGLILSIPVLLLWLAVAYLTRSRRTADSFVSFCDKMEAYFLQIEGWPEEERKKKEALKTKKSDEMNCQIRFCIYQVATMQNPTGLDCTAHLAEHRVFPCLYVSIEDARAGKFPCKDARELEVKKVLSDRSVVDLDALGNEIVVDKG